LYEERKRRPGDGEVLFFFTISRWLLILAMSRLLATGLME